MERTCSAWRVMKAASSSAEGRRPSTVSAMPTVCTGCSSRYSGLLAVRISAAARATSDEASWSSASMSVSCWASISCRRNRACGHGGMTMARTAGKLRAWRMFWSIGWSVTVEIPGAGCLVAATRCLHNPHRLCFNWLHCDRKPVSARAPPGGQRPLHPPVDTRVAMLLRPGMDSPRKSRKCRTAGANPRREGKTACTMPGVGAQSGSTRTKRRSRISSWHM